MVYQSNNWQRRIHGKWPQKRPSTESKLKAEGLPKECGARMVMNLQMIRLPHRNPQSGRQCWRGWVGADGLTALPGVYQMA